MAMPSCNRWPPPASPRSCGDDLSVRIASSVRDASVSDVFGTEARIGTESDAAN
jgi:hypothetical protein